MFHFPASPPTALYIQTAATCHHARQVSPFGHPRITARLTTPRGLSRPPTSFIGAWCQGIHRMPHSLGHHRNKMLAHTIHKSNNQPHTRPPPDRPTRTQSNRTHPEFAGMAPAETPTPHTDPTGSQRRGNGCSLRHPTARPHPPPTTGREKIASQPTGPPPNTRATHHAAHNGRRPLSSQPTTNTRQTHPASSTQSASSSLERR